MGELFQRHLLQHSITNQMLSCFLAMDLDLSGHLASSNSPKKKKIKERNSEVHSGVGPIRLQYTLLGLLARAQLNKQMGWSYRIKSGVWGRIIVPGYFLDRKPSLFVLMILKGKQILCAGLVESTDGQNTEKCRSVVCRHRCWVTPGIVWYLLFFFIPSPPSLCTEFD